MDKQQQSVFNDLGKILRNIKVYIKHVFTPKKKPIRVNIMPELEENTYFIQPRVEPSKDFDGFFVSRHEGILPCIKPKDEKK